MVNPHSSQDPDITNPGIHDAIARLSADPSAINRQILYERLLAGNLLIAVTDIPTSSTTEVFQLQEDTNVKVLTTTGPDGQPALLAFTDLLAIRDRITNVNFAILDSQTVLQMTLQGGYSSLLLNPGGPWACIPHEDIATILKNDKNA